MGRRDVDRSVSPTGSPRTEGGELPRLGVRACVTCVALVAVLAACGVEGVSESILPRSGSEAVFRGAMVEITTNDDDVVRIAVDVADTDELRATGLTNRSALAADAGMLLLYDEPQHVEVWMKDTLIPLSAAWFDEAGRIAWIEDLEPCRADPCTRYAASMPAVGVLEVNRGAFDGWGVALGDSLRILDP